MGFVDVFWFSSVFHIFWFMDIISVILQFLQSTVNKSESLQNFSNFRSKAVRNW